MLRLEDLTENQIKHLKESFAITAPIDAIRQPLEAAQKGLAEASDDIEAAKVAFPDTAQAIRARKDEDPSSPAVEWPPWEVLSNASSRI